MTEPRWVGQVDESSCGPISIVNALKWSGVKYNWGQNKHTLRKLCRTKYDGTRINNMERVLRKLGSATMTIQRRRKWKLQELVDVVEGRGCVIFSFTPPCRHNMALPIEERFGHFTTCVDIMGEGQNTWFKMVNLSRGETVEWIDRKKFRWLFCQRRDDDCAFLLRTKD